MRFKKRVFKGTQETPMEVELGTLLGKEKQLTARWYEILSGRGLNQQERYMYATCFEDLSKRIKELQAILAADQFELLTNE